MGLTEAEMFAIYEAGLKAARSNGNRNPILPQRVDPYALLRRDNDAEWLVQDIWPSGRQVHMHAPRKSGKSLVTLWISLSLATGRDPFTGDAVHPIRVGYLDYEMTEDDLAERVEEMGFTADQLDANWYYYLLPMLPPLDTVEGGQRLVELASTDELHGVVIDTLSRVVVGDENSNDTYIRFYKNTGQALKAAGIAMMRLDHEGHESGRSRGASSKADDVDLVWQFRNMDADKYQFVRKAARISWVPEIVNIQKGNEPTLSFHRADAITWPPGTAEKAQELDECDAPIDVTKRAATEMLKAHGLPAGRGVTLLAAIRYRKTRILGI